MGRFTLGGSAHLVLFGFVFTHSEVWRMCFESSTCSIDVTSFLKYTEYTCTYTMPYSMRGVLIVHMSNDSEMK